ncbi:hypothetical protein A2680_02135 [Candidatus Kaiserbacteria bacterium RIFCSPHIGHO2_01_FULL_55_37]|nr:MAG: hypothetical protein A2680_02135 [Candidatus Kaiserbacteria bacterium RIFCSPHIGHO2_01_FULL_55_37]
MTNDVLLQKPLNLSAINWVSREAIYLPTNYSLRFATPNARHHVVEYRAAGDFCGFLFHKLLYNFQTIASREHAKFCKLRLNGQHLLVLDIGAFASVEKIVHM